MGFCLLVWTTSDSFEIRKKRKNIKIEKFVKKMKEMYKKITLKNL